MDDLSDADINRIAANALLGAARESGMNQTQVANAAGMSPVTAQKVFSGSQGIKVHQFIRLANATDLTPADVMFRISAAIKRMSDAASTVGDELARKRAENTSKYTGDDFNEEGQPRAAITDPELEQDEP